MGQKQLKEGGKSILDCLLLLASNHLPLTPFTTTNMLSRGWGYDDKVEDYGATLRERERVNSGVPVILIALLCIVVNSDSYSFGEGLAQNHIDLGNKTFGFVLHTSREDINPEHASGTGVTE